MTPSGDFGSSTTAVDAPAPESVPRIVPTRHPGRWVLAAVVLILLAEMIHSAITNHAFLWGTYSAYFFSTPIIQGLRLTLELTVVAMSIGILLGILLAVMRLSTNPLLASFSWGYAWLFRGTPTLVQLIFFYNLGALYPHLILRVPFGPTLASTSTNQAITPFVAGILGLGLNEAAYMSEIVRGGILSVGRGQTEAAMGIGMTKGKTFRRIILPQAMRFIIPPTFNNIIGMLKYSSLVSVLSLGELLYKTEQIYSANFKPIPLLLVASTWYLICTSVLMVGQRFIERHLSRGYGRATSSRTPRLPRPWSFARRIA